MLGDYYNRCEDQLDLHFQDGNYYTDWIADELFVVVFTDYEHKVFSLAKQAIEFSESLIMAKKDFCRDNNVEIGIDIGISAGEAYIGMMGPRTHSKTTALGETPGISRRIQTIGKLLRHALGESDRILASKGVVEKTGSFREWEVFKHNRDFRDLNTDTVHHITLGTKS